MNVLVIGGAGYIGSHTVQALIHAGHTAWVYDNLSLGHRGAVPEGLLIEGDIHDQDRLVTALRAKEIDAVMHFAAFAFVGESVQEPAKYYHNNVVGTLSLLNAMRTADVNRIVFSSTCAVYGIPERLPIREETPLAPINPYGVTKLIMEEALEAYAQAYGLAAIALRYFNAAGAMPSGELGEDHAVETHLIPLVLRVALGQSESVPILGNDYPTPDGTCIRDYIHVHDLATAHIAALALLEPGKKFAWNLGTGRGFSVQEVIDACRRITGHPIPTEPGARRPGDPPILVADARLARRTLGWQPQYTTIDAIVQTAWNWHQSHPGGFSSRGCHAYPVSPQDNIKTADA